MATWALLLVAGCDVSSGSPPQNPPQMRVPDSGLKASATQYRFAEGSDTLRAAVVNTSERNVQISSATLVWSGMRFSEVRIADPVIPSGQAAAFTIAFDVARCDSPTATDRPFLAATVDGERRRLAVQVKDPDLLVRLRERGCAEQRLAKTASVSLWLADETVRISGHERVPGEVVVRRRGPGSVRVVDLGGSVLFEVLPRDKDGLTGAVMGPGDSELRLPVLVGYGHRCDGHARGQSSQTFLFSVYVRRDDAPTQREIRVPSRAEQSRLLAMLDRECARNGS